jgi:hypothetical protein
MASLWEKSPEMTFNIDRIDIEQLASIIQESGYKALIGQDFDKESFIASAQQGWNTTVHLRSEGKSFQFSLLVKNEPAISWATINDFNVKWRHVKLMLTAEGKGLHLVMDVDLEGGVSQLYLAKRVAMWDSMLVLFRDYLDKAMNDVTPRSA